MKELLVVVDMVNGFVNCGALADKNINKITPKIEEIIVKAKQKKMHIVAFKDCHKMTDEEFKVFPPHCLEGSLESDLIPELKKYEKDMLIINKNTTNGFITNKFLTIANKIEFDKVYVVGCCTDICVKDFVSTYINFNKKKNKNTQIIVIEDACYTFDGPNHNAEEAHNSAINYMKEIGAVIKKSKTQENTKE